MNGTSDSVVIASAADNRFAMPAGVMLHSALANLSPDRDARVFMLGYNLKEKNKKRIQRVVRAVRPSSELTCLEVAGYLPSGLKTSSTISAAAYARLLMPELIPDRFDKIVYLDADIVVVQDLQRLWDKPLDDHVLLAVQDYRIPHVSSPEGLSLYEALGLGVDDPYFNSGVLVVNLKKWRAEQISQRIFEYLQVFHEHVNWYDQDGLNAVTAGRWGALDLRWNQQTHLFCSATHTPSPFKRKLRARREQLVNDPFVVHYTGAVKPWHARCKHPEQERFLDYLRKSAWFTRLEWNVWRSLNLLRRPWQRIRWPVEQWLKDTTRPFRHWIRETTSESPPQ